MPKKLVRRGRVQGYRPSREHLEELLKLTQRGIDNDSAAKLIYSHGREEIYSEGDGGKILPENLGQVVSDAGDPAELNNLYFSISQDSPIRRVEIDIGPGDWTSYTIESDDQTWAHGRYHEITEKLLADRNLYAKGHSPAPQVPKDGYWRPAAWELVSDWRANTADYTTRTLWTMLWLGLLSQIIIILAALSYSHDTYTSPEVERSDHHNADVVLTWFGHNSVLLFFIDLSYIVMVILLRHRMRILLESKVILQNSKNSFFAQLGFQRNRNEAVALATLYLTFLILVVGIAALLV